MTPPPLHPQALDLLAAAGVTLAPHKTDPGLWVYTLPNGQQGQALGPQEAARVALDHLRGAVADLAVLVEVLTEEIDTMREQARAAAAVALRLAEQEGRER